MSWQSWRNSRSSRLTSKGVSTVSAYIFLPPIIFPPQGDSVRITLIFKSHTLNNLLQLLWAISFWNSIIQNIQIISVYYPNNFWKSLYNVYNTAFHTDQSKQTALAGFWDQIRQTLHSLSYMWLKLSILYNPGLHISCCTVNRARGLECVYYMC